MNHDNLLAAYNYMDRLSEKTAMAQTATFTLRAAIPIDDDPAIPAPIDLSVALTFGQKVDLELNFDAPVTDSPIPLGTMASAGAKALIVKCVSGSCTLKFNGDTAGKPVGGGGGGIAWVNPTTGWLTTLSVSTTGPAKIRVIALA